MLPSQEAVAMKRNQEKAKEENITALLDQRNQIKAMMTQNDVDLQHVGYNPPMNACDPGPVKYTRSEWQEAIKKEGYEQVGSLTLSNLKSELKAAHATISNMERKIKILRSKLRAKQRKDAGPVKRKANIKVPVAFRKAVKKKKK